MLDPFAGIGSVPWQAVKMGRRGIGIELKDTYYKQAVSNLQLIEQQYLVSGADTTVRWHSGRNDVPDVTQKQCANVKGGVENQISLFDMMG